jgi:nucleoside-diphosphate-sugar epimerase
MDVVGNGFIARHLRSSVGEHRDVIALAAGVSSTSTTSPEQFAREADLLGQTLKRCDAEGRRLVFFSTASAAMYGAPGCPGREDVPAVPQSPYGRHKLGLEERVADSGVGFLILRLGHAIGEGQPPHQLLPALVQQIDSGAVRVYRGARRDIIDIADVMAAIEALLRTPGADSSIVNIASGIAVPIEDIVTHIEDRLGVLAVREYVTSAQPTTGHISTAKLGRLVPPLAGRLLAEGYFRTVLDRYITAYAVPAVAASLTASPPYGSPR